MIVLISCNEERAKNEEENRGIPLGQMTSHVSLGLFFYPFRRRRLRTESRLSSAVECSAGHRAPFTNAMSDGWTDGWMDGPSRAAKFEAIIMTTSPNGSIR